MDGLTKEDRRRVDRLMTRLSISPEMRAKVHITLNSMSRDRNSRNNLCQILRNIETLDIYTSNDTPEFRNTERWQELKRKVCWCLYNLAALADLPE